MPKVSVVIPSYNVEKYIKETIDNILSQTFTDFELIIVDDSTDSTQDIIRSYTDPRIRLIQGNRQGVSNASNIAIKHATGEYIARMDADDIMYIDRLQKQVNFLDENPSIILCSTPMVTTEGWMVENYAKSPVEIRTFLLWSNAIAHPSAMYRREVFETHNLYYNETLKGCEDYELWLRAVEYGDFATLLEPLVKYRIHTEQNSNYLERDAEILKQIVPPYIKKSLGIDIPKKFDSLVVYYSMPKYTYEELLELHTFIEHILVTIENNPKFSLNIAIKKLSSDYMRMVISSKLSLMQLVKLKKAISSTQLNLIFEDISKKQIIKDLLKSYIPSPIFNLIKTIYRKIKY